MEQNMKQKSSEVTVASEGAQREFTLRAMVWGVVVGIVMMALLAYMYAVLGIDMNVSPVSIVLGILLVPVIGGKTNVREVTQMQTTASAVASFMSAIATCYVASLWFSEDFNIFIPAIIMLLSSATGICLVTVLRKQFLDDPNLAFPHSVICITALDNVGQMKGKPVRILFLFVLIGVVVVFCQNVLGVIPLMVDFTPYLPEGMTMGILLMPMMIGLGYVLGARACAYLFIGSLVSNLVLAPIGMHLGWYASAGVNYGEMQTFNVPILVGMALVAVLIPLLKQWRTLKNSLQIDTQASKESGREFSLRWYFIGIVACLIGLVLVFWLYYRTNPLVAALLLLICLVFSLICFRVFSEIGLSAQLALAVALITLSYLLTKDVVASTMMAVVMSTMATLAQNTMMDLKTGHTVGASSKKQVWAQFVGIIPGTVIGLVFFFVLVNVYGLNSDYATFPIGKMYYSVAAGLSGEASGVFSVSRLLIGVAAGTVLTLFGLPATIFGLSLYLAPYTICAIALGGLIKWILTKAMGEERAKVFDNASVGLILGDTLVSIGITVMTFLG